MDKIGWVASWLILAFFGALFNGYALSIMWGWFITPVFDLPTLTVSSAIGISMIVGYLTKTISITPKKDKKTDGESFLEASIHTVLKPTFALCFGWVVTLFV